ncbi:hypothetical protein [Solitalea lacus]|uniref:hypothetical protein n=1 Tax=Solitalea lacus TaxID=2911172 RepID=UPI001EDBB779|nr:hypothetical protein [Solitalea lacus]UKJ07366.1 hypothetical protein L2B55_17815 [Solitalea lacus]
MENLTSSEKNTNDEILEQLIKKVNELDKRKTDFPDYASEFEALKNSIQEQAQPIKELERIVTHHNFNYPAIQIQHQIEEVKTMVSKMPKIIPVKHLHSFDPRSKGWILSGVFILIVVAISTGLCAHLFIENGRLSANDIKFRMLRQIQPEYANSVEESYYKNPEAMEVKVIQLENEAKRRAEVQARINRAETELNEARKQLFKGR